MRRYAALVAVLLTLTGCAAAQPGLAPGAARVDVDTPELRKMKRQAGVEDCARTDAPPVDGGLPDVSLPCLGGGPAVQLGGVRGPTVVSLWASWCGPCRKEMPIFQQFHERYADQVPVLGIDYEDPQTTNAMELVQDTGVTYPLLADPQADLSAAEPFPVLRGMPFLALVAADGTVVHQEFVIIDSLDQLVELVETELGVAL